MDDRDRDYCWCGSEAIYLPTLSRWLCRAHGYQDRVYGPTPEAADRPAPVHIRLRCRRNPTSGAETMSDDNVIPLDDHRPFDIGTPTRCWFCGTDREVRQSCGDGGFVWACPGCPHPAD